jgi:hypothetical protein
MKDQPSEKLAYLFKTLVGEDIAEFKLYGMNYRCE